MSGKPKEVSISTTTIVIIMADISRALAMCRALSPELYTLTCLGGRLLLSSHFGGHRDTKKRLRSAPQPVPQRRLR